eukprot:GHUV01018171.1.p1 GENE.GHUV01018171.1~~GHUV01018171.1.p1  ORF type:complete len:959 (+),score=392.27 GHUV01018171.1:54-2930(+)
MHAVNTSMRRTASVWSVAALLFGLSLEPEPSTLVLSCTLPVQFLPQDKVVEFARMDQYELLVATEKAIGDASLFETHQKLIAQRNTAKDKEAVLKTAERKHEQLVQENQRLERDYERHNKKKKLQDRIEVMKKKAKWMRVKEADDLRKETEAAEKQAEDALKQAKQEARADERPAHRRKEEADNAKRTASELQLKVRKHEQEASAAADKISELEAEVRKQRQELNGLQAESDKWTKTKETYRTKVENLKKNLAQLPPIPDHSARIAEIGEQMQSVREQINHLEGEKGELANSIHAAKMEINRLQAQLRECDSAKYQRLQSLRHKQKGMLSLEDALNWVNQMKQQGRFRGPVAGPLGLDMKVKMPSCAKYLEQATFGQLCNFAVQHKEDADTLSDKFKEMALRANAITITDNASQYTTNSTAHMRDYGVVCSLDEVYDAPPLVKHCLANMCNLGNVLVVNHDDTDRVKQLMDEQRVRQVYTPQRIVNFIASAYGGREDASLSISGLNAAAGQILGGGAADVEERKTELQSQHSRAQGRLQELEQQAAAIDAQVQPLDQQLQELQAERQQLGQEVQQAHRQRSTMQSQIKKGLDYIARLESQPDPMSKAPRLQQQLAKALDAHYKCLCKQLKATEDQWQALEQHAAADLTSRELDMQAKAMAAAIAARRSTVNSLELALRTAQQVAKNARDSHKRLKEEATHEYALTADDKELFQKMPDDREELDEMIQGMEAEVAGISVNNPRVVEEYRKRQQEIQKLEAELQTLRNMLETAKAQIESLKASWQPELERVVGLINDSFSTNFAQIGCAGEVLLGKSEDYDKFSIQIKVKFRENEQLEMLTAHRQSGGERSVSTILYLIALQGVTVTPFRVVDEINQGMDPINERKVFMQLVDASCQEGTPQCFLLTPKLLPDLPFTEDITVLNIFNGGLIAEQAAGQYSREALFGTKNLAALQGVRVVG